MKKPINISVYAGIECIIHSFKHDVNGNPIAKHIVNAYKWNVQTSPTDCLYESGKRSQVSYAGTATAYGDSALTKAGINPGDVTFSHCSGSRSEDSMSVFYIVKKHAE